MNRRVTLAAKTILGTGLICWLIKSGRLDVSVYSQILTESHGWSLLAAFVAQSLSLTIVLGRWWGLIHVQGIPISPLGALCLSWRGVFTGLFMPGTIGLDGVRILFLRRHFRTQLTAGMASLLVDRVLGFVGLAALSIGVGGVYAIMNWDTASAKTLTAILNVLLVSFLIICIAAYLGHTALRKIRPLAKFLEALTEYREHPATLFHAIALSVVGHFLTCVAMYFGLSALGISSSLMTVTVVTPLVIAIRFLPLTPLGLGISDGAAESLYSTMGIEGGAEVQMLLRATMIIILLCCGIGYYFRVE